MFEIGSGGERIDFGVGKALVEKTLEARAELFATHARRGARRIGAQEFEAARFRSAESLYFEDDAILGLFADAEDAAGQIAFFRPQVNERILAFGAKFAAQPGQLGQPLAVFANFRAARGRHRVQSPIELGPFIHRQTVLRLENSQPAAAKRPLLQNQARYADRRILLIPHGGNMSCSIVIWKSRACPGGSGAPVGSTGRCFSRRIT